MSQNSTFEARFIDVNNISNRPYLLIDKPVFKIGRHPESDFVIKENTVSERHAVIEQKQSGFYIVNQDNSSKTRVNGAELDPNMPKQLNDGDEIQIDTFSFVFKLEKIEATPPDTDQYDDETVFFDSSTIMPGLKGAEPQTLGPGQDDDETIFLDSGAIMPEMKKVEPPTPGPSYDDDETVSEEPKVNPFSILQKLKH